ncbi:MAG: D-alanyl-D-alanine carboxypeptidase/D-alanyl-D-alanine-endopeptidase [Candidatus Fermentibacteraceae bacterium]|nr:D-alanyl-D-alanine carboxypeptidase/D-alanyl-D-alanine-endopeptidase [Candidatus Fermentibacteraceae bacterium]
MNPFIHLILLLSVSLQMPEIPSAWRAGIYVQDAETGDILMSRNEDQTFRPASTVKLVTSYIAFLKLGSSFVYETEVLADISGGNLYIIGSGAPLLSAEHIEIMAIETAASLAPGSSWRLFWDTSQFNEESHCPGWDQNDWSRVYCPPIEGLSIGDNVLQVIVSTVGDSMRTFIYPQLPGLVITNDLVIGNRIQIRTTVAGWDDKTPRITLQGTMAPDTQIVMYKPFAGPPMEFSEMFSIALESTGLSIDTVMQGEAPDDTTLIRTSVIYSDPLFVLLTSMNKWSRNMVAEMVLRTVSLETASGPASTGAGCDVAGQILRDLVPDIPGAQLADGSGLSRLNLLAPGHLAAILSNGINSLEWGVEFLATLPVNGVDGTLASRLSNLPPGAFRGKTGTLNDTSTIAGILTASSGRRIILVIMLEVPVGYNRTARAWQDSFISWCWDRY